MFMLHTNKANGEENECKLIEALNISYRNEILSKEFNSIEDNNSTKSK